MTTRIILIVEDDPTLRLLTAKQLQMLGFESTAESSGERAVERSHDDVCLIFMDIGLPGISGTEAAMLIREKELRESRPRVPIVALTAHSDRQQCLMAGMDDFVQKPVQLTDIERILQKWLSNHANTDRPH